VNKLFAIDIALVIAAPFLVQGSEPGAFGLDTVIERDQDDCPIVPGTLLIGKMRDAWREFAKDDLTECWLGKEADEEFNPKRGRLVESDLRLIGWSKADSKAYPPYPRVAIDEFTGTAKTGALQFIEQPWAIGQRLNFSGTWHAVSTQAECDTLCKSIAAALRWTGQIGAEATIGFGQIESVSVSCTAVPESSATVAPENANRWYYTLSTDAPLMISQQGKITDNLFQSSDEIPGNVIKAALALTLSAKNGNFAQPLSQANGGDLGSAFDKITFSHALPASQEGIRPAVLPASVVAIFDAGTDKVFDATELNKPHLINSAAPAFPIDWKPNAFRVAEAALDRGWCVPPRRLRVRTAIDVNTGGAKESQLFAYEQMYAPENGWVGWIDTSSLSTHEKTALATALSSPMLYLGKTKAKATLTVHAHPPRQCLRAESAGGSTCKQGDQLVVMLNSPALLNPIDEVHDDIAASYQEFWKDASDDALSLSHFFASQYLVGGEYAAQFRRKDRPYRPWLITRAGSIFVLTVTNAEIAQRKLAVWQATNLPLTKSIADCHGETWRENPYLPQNGYGEILVNPKFGSVHKPAADQLSLVEEIAL